MKIVPSNNNKKHVDIPLETSVKVDAIIEKDEVKLTTSYAASIQSNSHVEENDRDISISKRDDSRDRGRRDDSRDRRRDDSRDREKRDNRDSRDDKKFSLDNRSRKRRDGAQGDRAWTLLTYNNILINIKKLLK